MSFTSARFVLFVLAAVVLYYLAPKKGRWVVLLGASYLFYAVGGGRTVGYLLVTTLSTWLAGLALGAMNAQAKGGDRQLRQTIKTRKRLVVLAALLLNFGMLYVLKYWGFTVEQLNKLPHVSLTAYDFLLPLGVSFYIFQSAGYVIDCYRGKDQPEANPAKFALFVSFFPQMVQGPISRFRQLSPQLIRGNDFDADNLKYGIQLMLWGYFKKMVIAERAGVLVNTVFDGYWNYGGATLAAGVFFYCIQLYCDFSGGIDVTRGVARLFGIDMAENFRRPIYAKSLADYWRRWHITLGQWMRDYVFYPLSLSKPFGRLGKWSRKHIGGKLGKIVATSLATFIVYLIIGIWHGANFRYIAFGFWNGGVITFSLLMEGKYHAAKEKLNIDDKALPWRLWQMARTCVIVFLGRYITRAPRLLTAVWMITQLWRNPCWGDLTSGTLLTLGLGARDIAVVFVSMLVVLLVELYQEKGGQVRKSLEQRHWAVQWAAMVLPLLVILLLGVMGGDYVPAGFIYQQF